MTLLAYQVRKLEDKWTRKCRDRKGIQIKVRIIKAYINIEYIEEHMHVKKYDNDSNIKGQIRLMRENAINL
jgi:hypothetical protein